MLQKRKGPYSIDLAAELLSLFESIPILFDRFLFFYKVLVSFAALPTVSINTQDLVTWPKLFYFVIFQNRRSGLIGRSYLSGIIRVITIPRVMNV